MPDKNRADPEERDEVRGDDVPGERTEPGPDADAGGPILPNPAAAMPAGSPLPFPPEDFPPEQQAGEAQDELKVVRGPEPLDPDSNERDYRPARQLHAGRRYHYGRQPG